MKKTYKIIWAESAEKDLSGILAYVARDSPTHALKIFRTIKANQLFMSHSLGFDFFVMMSHIQG
jgi:hypothetical protein